MNTQIILDSQYKLDLTEDISLLFTYQCGDVRNVLSRNSSLSRSISIFGTANNNQAFGNLFEIRNYSNFNPNKKAPCIVVTNGITIFEGYLKVDSIKITNSNLISYECTIYSNVSDFFSELASLKLNELDFSEYNHTYTQDAVVNSWNNYIYLNGQQTPVRKGLGYVYPYIDLGYNESITNNKYVDFFKPCFYAKTILDKVFSETDYTYQSDFLTSDYFKSLLVVPSPDSFNLPASSTTSSDVWVSQELSDADNEILILQGETGSTSFQSSGIQLLQMPNNNVGGRFDQGNNWNTTLMEYTIPVTGYYNVVANFNLDISISNNHFAPNAPINLAVSIDGSSTYFTGIIFVQSGASYADSFALGSYYMYGQYISGPNFIQPSVPTVNTTLNNNDVPFFTNNGTPINFNFDDGQNYLLEEGWKIFIQVVNQTVITSHSTSQQFVPRINLLQTTPSDLKINLVTTLMQPGMQWNFKNFISSDQCNDYILSLAKMFNLYFEFAPENPNTLIIEPRKDFYNGEVLDWTYKLDRSNEIEIIPMAELSSKNLHFLYRNDSDYWNNRYQTENLSSNKFSLLSQKTYGEYTYYFDNDFVDQASEDKIDLIFAPTPLVQDNYYVTVTGGTYSASSRIISTAYQEQFDQQSGNIKKTALNSFAPRILFYNGLLPCDSWGIYTDTYNANKLSYSNYISSYNYNVAHGLPTGIPFIDFPASTLNYYPYVGHLDNPYEPNYDLNFSYPAEYFYARTGVTSSNLFNQYWFDTTQEIEDVSSKIFTGYFKLDISDIQNLSFRNIIYLDSQYWIINKIEDYNPLDNGLTKVELLKMINYNQTGKNVPQVQPRIYVNGSSSTTVPVGTNPRNGGIIGIITTGIVPINNTNIIQGWGNTVSPNTTGNIIIGNNNHIPIGIGGSIIIGNGLGFTSGTTTNNLQPNSLNTPIVNVIGTQGQINWNGRPVITVNTTGVNIIGTQIRNTTSIASGRNQVLNEFSIANNVNFISAGRNQLRGFGSSTVINHIDSGRNITFRTP